MNPKLEKLKPYPFERLRILLAEAKPDLNQELIRWSIGEPSGAPPPFVLDVLKGSLASLGNYPTTLG
ncbi:MAG TPA: succinyldiaminopimelate transaminase, partial [Candidatus Melainabacteria bacterium]|nr:succinyldiaminopimelate transaminase [Candidatus Melainabacteria bacterium]